MQALCDFLLVYLRVVGEEGLKLFCLPANAEVDHPGEFFLDDDEVVLAEVVGVLRVQDHQHEDGVLEVGVRAALRRLHLLVGDDQVDDRLHHFALQHPLDLVHELRECTVLVPEGLTLATLVLRLVEVLYQLFQGLHLPDALYHEVDALLDLGHFCLVGRTVFHLELLEFLGEINHIEGVGEVAVSSCEVGPARVEDACAFEDPAGFVVDVIADEVGVLGEVALEERVVDESEDDDQFAGEQVEVGLHVLDVVPLGLHGQPVQVHLAQHSVDQLEVEGLDLQSFQRLLDCRPQFALLRLEEVQGGAVVPDAFVLLLMQDLAQDGFEVLSLAVDGGSAKGVLEILLHLDRPDDVLEGHEVARLAFEFLLDLVGAEVVEVEWVGGGVDAGEGGVAVEGLLLDLAQPARHLLKRYPLVHVLLQAPGHQVQQLRTETVPLLDVDQVVQDLAPVECFEGVREDHRVDVHAQEVDVGVLLDFPEFIAGEILEAVLGLSDELHDLERSGVLHEQSVPDVAVVGVALDEGGVEVGNLDLLVMEEDVLGTQVAVDDATAFEFLQALDDLAGVLDDLVLSEGVLLLGLDAVDVFLERPLVHLLQHEHHVLDALRASVGQPHHLVVESAVLRALRVLVGEAEHLDGADGLFEEAVAVELGGDLVEVLALGVVVDHAAQLVGLSALAVGHAANDVGGQFLEGDLILYHLAEVEGALRVDIALARLLLLEE